MRRSATIATIWPFGFFMVRQFMQCAVSFAVLAAGLYLLLNPTSPADLKAWSQNAIAMLIGYWLRGR